MGEGVHLYLSRFVLAYSEDAFRMRQQVDRHVSFEFEKTHMVR